MSVTSFEARKFKTDLWSKLVTKSLNGITVRTLKIRQKKGLKSGCRKLFFCLKKFWLPNVGDWNLTEKCLKSGFPFFIISGFVWRIGSVFYDWWFGLIQFVLKLGVYSKVEFVGFLYSSLHYKNHISGTRY